MKNNINISPLIFFIIIEILNINTLWGESLHRRVLHHIQNNYDKNKIPWISTTKNLLDNYDLNKVLKISCKNTDNGCSNINTYSKILSNLTNSNYSKRSAIYYHEFNNETKEYLTFLGNKIKHKFEKICGEKLVLSNSKDFKAILLRYEGEDANFPMHYDTELAYYYRTLILIKKNGECPPFIYYDKNGKKIKIHLQVNEGIFFKGSQTYHGVESTNDPNTVRYMLGFQYLPEDKINAPIPKSICTELSGNKTTEMINKLWPNILLTLLIGIFSYVIGSRFKLIVSLNKFILICFIIIISSLFLPNLLPLYIGTNRNTDFKILFIYILLSSLFLVRIDLIVIGYVSYILITEMLLPSFIIKKTIINNGTL